MSFETEEPNITRAFIVTTPIKKKKTKTTKPTNQKPKHNHSKDSSEGTFVKPAH